MPEPTESQPDSSASRFAIDLAGVTLMGLYRVERKLAEGGMGAIYAAEDTNLGRRVVVKVPHTRFLGDAGFRDRLAREVEELIRLEHPHIVRILARGEHEELPFFVLQFLGGGSLEDRLATSGGRQDAEETLAWLTTTAGTLDFVHGRGIVHRDVKPANVLFDEDGHVFLSDFGVAKALQAEGAELTQTGVSIGSPKYMAPEQGVGRAVGPAADQYALASTLYEALAGRAPFEGEQIVEVLVRKMREAPPSLATFVPELPEEATAAVMRALAQDPDERFPTCRAFAEAFRKGLDPLARTEMAPAAAASTPAAQPQAFAQPASAPSPSKRRPWRPWILAGIGLAVLAVLFLALHGPDAPPPLTEATEPGDAKPAAVATTKAEDEAEPMRVTLLEPGAEPRRALRYLVGKGARERLRMVTRATTDFELNGEAQALPKGAGMVLDSDVHVEDVTEAGQYEFRWEITACDVVEEERDGAPAALREQLQKFVGISARAIGDAQGRMRDVALDVPEEHGVFLGPQTAGLSVGLGQMSIPLPAEDVGVGARWEVMSTNTHMGIRVTETTTYEVLSVEGHEVRIKSARAMTAPPQDVKVPGMPEGMNVRVKSFHVGGAGETLLDLSRAVPIDSTIEVVLRMEAEHEQDGKIDEITLKHTVDTALMRR